MWTADKQRAPNGGTYYRIRPDAWQNNECVAMVGPWDASKDGYTAEQNARLISAAPELLAVLELIYANAAESPEWIRARIDPVMAKVNGNP